MESRRWSEVVTMFDELVELEPVTREQRLSEIARSDPELRRSIEDLLTADAQAEDRLARIDQALAPAMIDRMLITLIMYRT